MKLALTCTIALGTLTMVSCDKNGGDPPQGAEPEIEIPNESELTQTAFADEETTGGFTFVAKSAWTATVEETTSDATPVAISRAGGVAWIQLLIDNAETYSGGAGSFFFLVKLAPNYTGRTRYAAITIRLDGAGGKYVRVLVTQEGMTEAGEVPEDPDAGQGRLVAKMVVTSNEPDEVPVTQNYTYDGEKRIAKIETIDFDGADTEFIMQYAYSSGKVTIDGSLANSEGVGTLHGVLTLNASGYVTNCLYEGHMESEHTPEENEDWIEQITMEYLNDRIHKVDGTEVTPTTCTWDANGNMTKMELFNSGGQVMETYTAEYTAIPNNLSMDMNFDMWPYMGGFTGGAIPGDFNGKRSTNLVSKVTYSSLGAETTYHLAYEYVFDDDGLLVKIVKTDSGDGSVETWTISYQ